jgi:hypothetical protein
MHKWCNECTGTSGFPGSYSSMQIRLQILAVNVYKWETRRLHGEVPREVSSPETSHKKEPLEKNEGVMSNTGNPFQYALFS